MQIATLHYAHGSRCAVTSWRFPLKTIVYIVINCFESVLVAFWSAKRLQTEPEKIEAEVMRRAKEAAPNNPNGTNQHTTPGIDNCKTLDGNAGNSADYLTARIARDRPDILEDMKEGKYRSVRAYR